MGLKESTKIKIVEISGAAFAILAIGLMLIGLFLKIFG